MKLAGKENGGGRRGWNQYFCLCRVGHEMPVTHPNGWQAGRLAAEGDMGSREVFFSSRLKDGRYYKYFCLLERIQQRKKKWMMQKKENNFSGNSWRRGDHALETNGRVGFDGSRDTSLIINRREDREYE